MAGFKVLGTGITWTPDEFTDWNVSVAGFYFGVKFVPDSTSVRRPDVYVASVPGAGLVYSNSKAGLNAAVEKATAVVETSVLNYNKVTTPLVAEFHKNLRNHGTEFAREELAQDLAQAMLSGANVINDRVSPLSLSDNQIIERATEIAAKSVIRAGDIYADGIIRRAAGYEGQRTDTVVRESAADRKTGPSFEYSGRNGNSSRGLNW